MEKKFVTVNLREVRKQMEANLSDYNNKHSKVVPVQDEILAKANQMLGVDYIEFTGFNESKEIEGAYDLSFDMYIENELITNFSNGQIVFYPNVSLTNDGKIAYNIEVAPVPVYEGAHSSDTVGFMPNYAERQASPKKAVKSKKKGFLEDKPHLKQLLKKVWKVYTVVITILFITTFFSSSKANSRVYEMESVLQEKGAMIQDGKLLEINDAPQE